MIFTKITKKLYTYATINFAREKKTTQIYGDNNKYIN